MTACCSRVGCGDPAVAVLGFDAAAALVWLDPFDGKTKGAGRLCAAHADSLTPLRGWNLVDRRVRAPRLWAERPPVVTPAPSAPRRVRRQPLHHAEGTEPLPFGAVADSPSEPALGSELDQLLDARTPLLARAFQPSRIASRFGSSLR
jgi:hypothetical protein